MSYVNQYWAWYRHYEGLEIQFLQFNELVAQKIENRNPNEMAEHETRLGPVSSAKSVKVAQGLQKKIEDGEYYEALQTYKALYSRYRAQGKDQEAVDLVYGGAVTLLQHEQWECGNELAMILVTFYKENKTPVTEATMATITRLFFLYHLPSQTAKGADSIALRLKDLAEVSPRELFMRAALKWSSMVGNLEVNKYGHPELHKLLARQYWKEKQYLLSADHFLHADDPDNFSEMLVEFATTYGYPVERELFIVRTVLQLLVLKKPQVALSVYRHYVSKHPQLSDLTRKDPPYEGEPGLNFAWFLVCCTVQLKQFSPQVLAWIRRHYKGVIDRDPSFSDYMDKIGVIYCGISPEPKAEVPGLMGLLGGAGAGGMFDTLMGSLTSSGPALQEALPGAVPLASEPQTNTDSAVLDSDDVLD